MKRSLKALSLRLFALLVCTVPPIIATLSYFPIWRARGEGAALSGFTVLLLLISAYPLVKAVKRLLSSPSVFTVWLLLFLTFLIIRSIAYEMTVISFVGFVSNLIGACIFKITQRGSENESAA